MDAKMGLDSTTNGREWARKMGLDSTVHGRLGNHEWTRRWGWIRTIGSPSLSAHVVSW